MPKTKVTEHSPNYEKVKNYYEKGLWSIDRVHNAVVKGWITPEEFEEITGQPYESK